MYDKMPCWTQSQTLLIENAFIERSLWLLISLIL